MSFTGVSNAAEAPISFAPNGSPSSSSHFPLRTKGFHLTSFQSVHSVSGDWERAAPAANLFLQRPFLKVIEENPPKNLRFNYLIFYKNDTPVGVAYCQISPFNPDVSIREENEKPGKFPCIIRAFSYFLKNVVVGKNHNLLICGNLLLTGGHGFYFDPAIDKALAFDLLEEALEAVQTERNRQGLNIDGVLIKDLAQEQKSDCGVFVERNFRAFTFHPNMILEIRKDWNSFEDYLDELSSKYRMRVRRALRLSEHIERKELTEEEIYQAGSQLFELYQLVANNQDFNMVALNEGYLPALKTHLSSRFHLYGYYAQGKLIGFYTTILNHGELEAHFLGYQPGCNKTCQVYFNMLLDILRNAVELKASRVIYARTAMEIKSSVGADAHDTYCYIRANNRLTNKILSPAIEYLRPPDDWVARHPFKGSE